MKLVDSSGWLEFFTDGPLAGAYADHLADLSQVVTPTVSRDRGWRQIEVAGKSVEEVAREILVLLSNKRRSLGPAW